MEIRLQKYLAEAGIASRRKSEEIILAGRVYVNGEIITQLGAKVDTAKDIVAVDGKEIHIAQKNVYIMLNKPMGCVSTVKDQFDRPTVLDCIKDVTERVYPIGRLDYDTSGMLLLTNDGKLTYKLTHPKHNVVKTYFAKIKGVPTNEEMTAFENGLEIDDYITAPAEIEIVSHSRNFSHVTIRIHEGHNRQVRKMCEKINHPVLELKRTATGKLQLGDLKKGHWRYLTEDEVEYLKNC